MILCPNCIRSKLIRHLIPFKEICRSNHDSSNATPRRVVVTGLGAVSGLGVGVQPSWARLMNKETGIKAIRDADKFGDIKAAGHVDEAELNLETRFSATERRTLSKATLYALIAAEEALKDARIGSDVHSEQFGVSIGQGMVDLEYIFESLTKKKLSPYFVTRMLTNMAGGHVAIKYSFKGPNVCQSTACASGLHSIGDAYEAIRRGQAKAMLCGATEAALNRIGVEAFARMRALSTKGPEEGPSRPFDQDRDGFVLGEGCGLLVLEELQGALQRKAPIKAEIVGFGASCDAGHITQPTADGARRSMLAALHQATAGLGGSQLQDRVSLVNAHATSTPLGDQNELRACEAVFGSRPLNITSCKGAIGHLLGASGAVELVFTVKAIQEAKLPPSLNVVNAMDTSLSIVQEPSDWVDDERIALKNSLGFGGTNATIIVAKCR
ncbi:3-oxoacyl-[acyl-carrier-protein] synthase, mitochondrial [Halotydeus destructor]|nr:3-oxoacyl-[acyl-carrier-protein] synthase, mitochondrial [Halotydeus destructor]